MRRLRSVAITLLFALAGGAIGFLLLPERAPQAAGHVRVRVGGKPVTLDASPAELEGLALRIAREYLAETVELIAGTEHRTMTRERLGVAVDVDHLRKLLSEASDPTSELRLIHQQELPGR